MNQQLCTALSEKFLAPREIQTAYLAARGLRNKAIAADMGIEVSTIKVYMTIIFRKLNLKSRAELIVWCAHATNGQFYKQQEGATSETKKEEVVE